MKLREGLLGELQKSSRLVRKALAESSANSALSLSCADLSSATRASAPALSAASSAPRRAPAEASSDRAGLLRGKLRVESGVVGLRGP